MACFATPYGLRYAAHYFNRADAQDNRPALIPVGGKLGVTSPRMNHRRGLKARGFCGCPASCRTASTNHTKKSLTTAASHGESSRISLGEFCLSAYVAGLMSHDQWVLVSGLSPGLQRLGNRLDILRSALGHYHDMRGICDDDQVTDSRCRDGDTVGVDMIVAAVECDHLA